jgi:hypothetical protein
VTDLHSSRCWGSHRLFSTFPTPLKHLRELALLSLRDVEVYADLFKELGSSLRHLYLHHDLNSTSIIPSITPVLGNLVHLELSTEGFGSNIVVQVVLAHGFHLESLRLSINGPSSELPSVHFRTYANALPQLRNFAFHSKCTPFRDIDFFPAILIFLQDRPLLGSLELFDTSSGDDIGIKHDSWNFLISMPHLHRLSMIIPSHFPIYQAARVIPRTVRSLGLSGYGASEWFSQEYLQSVCIDKGASWWPN